MERKKKSQHAPERECFSDGPEISVAVLKDSLDRQREILEAFGGMVFVCSQDRRIEFMSGRIIRRIGGDATGDYCDHLPPEWRYACTDCPAGEGGVPEKYVCGEFRDPVDNRWYTIVNNPILRADGSVSRLILIQDVTDRKTAQEALRESEERFRATFEQAAVGMVHMAPGGKWIRVNDKLCDILGYSREELFRLTVDSLIHPDDFQEYLGKMKLLLKGSVPHIYSDKRCFRKGGDIVWTHSTVSLLRDDAGAPKYFFSVIEDISRRREAEKELERALVEMDAIFAAMAEGVVIYGSTREILRMNPAARRVLGYPKDNLGKPFDERISRLRPRTPEGRLHTSETFPVARVLAGKIVRGEVVLMDRADGKEIWTSVSGAPLYLDNQVAGAVLIFTDVTRLQSLQQEREDYFQMISHDLSSPLTLIQGHAELLGIEMEKKGLNEGNPALHIHSILASARGMSVMMEDLLDLARIGKKEMILRHEPVDIAGFVDDFLKRFLVAAEGRRISSEISDGLRPVNADPERVERFFTNLLTNALKYSPAGKPITIRAEEKNGEMLISIEDRGRGIARKDLSRIFDRFYRASKSSGSAGLGLGLYITRKLVEAHGGRIWAESQPGKGSTFRFTLPLTKDNG